MATARWRLDLAYDGAAFSGFALQPEHPSVVGVLRETLARTLRLAEAPYLTGAGRTDAGVHAWAQVVSLDLDEAVLDDEGAAGLVRSLNAQLAGRVAVRSARRVPEDFDARHSALWRSYRYLISTGPNVGPVSHVAWALNGPLDLAAMNAATGAVLGEHDFRAFCKRPADRGPDEALVRRVLEARWSALEDPAGLAGPGGLVMLSVRASSFCHHLVRRLVGAVVAVGQGRLGVEVIGARLASGSGEGLPGPAPASGLCLMGVGYEPRHGGASGTWTV